MQQLGRVLKDRVHRRLLGAAVRIFHGSVQAPHVPGEGLSHIRCPHVTTCAALSCLSQLPLSSIAQLSVACCVLQLFFEVFFWRLPPMLLCARFCSSSLSSQVGGRWWLSSQQQADAGRAGLS